MDFLPAGERFGAGDDSKRNIGRRRFALAKLRMRGTKRRRNSAPDRLLGTFNRQVSGIRRARLYSARNEQALRTFEETFKNRKSLVFPDIYEK